MSKSGTTFEPEEVEEEEVHCRTLMGWRTLMSKSKHVSMLVKTGNHFLEGLGQLCRTRTKKVSGIREKNSRFFTWFLRPFIPCFDYL